VPRIYQHWNEAETRLAADEATDTFVKFQVKWGELKRQGLLAETDVPRRINQWRNKRREASAARAAEGQATLAAIAKDTPKARRVSASRIAPSPRTPRTIGARIKTDGLLILSDCHIPSQDHELMNKCIDLALSWGVKDVLLAGDLINNDAFSTHANTAADDTDSFEIEMLESSKAMEALQNTFERVFHMQGNHEIRLMKSSPIGHYLWEQWWQKGSLTLTDFEWVEVVHGKDKWRVSHPRRGRATPLSFARQLATKKRCNTIVAHQHLNSMGRDISGYYYAIDCGMSANPDLIPYQLKTDGTTSEMQQGAVILKASTDDHLHPYLLSPDMDWKAMAKLYNK